MHNQPKIQPRPGLSTALVQTLPARVNRIRTVWQAWTIQPAWHYPEAGSSWPSPPNSTTFAATILDHQGQGAANSEILQRKSLHTSSQIPEPLPPKPYTHNYQP